MAKSNKLKVDGYVCGRGYTYGCGDGIGYGDG